VSHSVRPIPLVLATSTLTGGGAEKQLYLFLRGLDRRRFRPEVITYVWGQWAEKIRSLGIPVHWFDYRRGRLAAIRDTYAYLKAQRPLILHAWGVTAGLIARTAARLARIPIIIMSERNAPLENWQAHHFWLELVLRRFTTRYLTNSRHAAEVLASRKLVPRGRIAVVPNGIDLSDYPLAEGSGNELLIGYTGTFKPQKNHLFLVAAASRVAQEWPQARFLFLGDGPLRPEIEAAVRSHGLDRQVTLLGWVDKPQETLRRLDLYVHVARFEGLPNGLMEAMACGLPCIAARIPGCEELIEPEKTGILYPPDNPEKFTQAISRLLGDRQLARRLGHQGRAAIQQHYRVETMVQRIQQIYEAVLSSANTDSPGRNH
jgi:glycosyltransferase involved in cell wall biosynthesis